MILAIIAITFFAVGLYFLLRRGLFGLPLGILLLGNAVNLVIFLGVNPKVGGFALIGEAGEVPADPNDALAQAMILTAIVIGFAFLCFIAALVKRLSSHYDVQSLEDITQEGLS